MKPYCDEANKIVLISHSALLQSLIIIIILIIIISVLSNCNSSATKQYDTLRRTKSGN